jgi:hypothetical protein
MTKEKKLIYVELRYDDGSAYFLEGNDANDWLKELNDLAVLAHSHSAFIIKEFPWSKKINLEPDVKTLLAEIEHLQARLSRDNRHAAMDLLKEALSKNALQHTGPLTSGKCTEACVLCEARKLLDIDLDLI